MLYLALVNLGPPWAGHMLVVGVTFLIIRVLASSRLVASAVSYGVGMLAIYWLGAFSLGFAAYWHACVEEVLQGQLFFRPTSFRVMSFVAAWGGPVVLLGVLSLVTPRKVSKPPASAAR